MGQKICGVTGHREIPAEYMEQAEQDLRREIEKAIADGYTYFISGFADGADQLFARIVLEKAKENPALRLEAAIPYRNRYKRLMEDGQTRAMLEACAKVAVISEEWASNVYMKRNRYMGCGYQRGMGFQCLYEAQPLYGKPGRPGDRCL